MTAENLIPCPWCGSTDIYADVSEICCPVQWSGGARCRDCGAEEPNGSGVHDRKEDAEQAALKEWGIRLGGDAGKDASLKEAQQTIFRLQEEKRQAQLTAADCAAALTVINAVWRDKFSTETVAQMDKGLAAFSAICKRDATQASEAVVDRLPYDIGSEAYHNRKLPEENPYTEKTWQHDEWYLGWSQSEKSDDSEAFDYKTGKFK